MATGKTGTGPRPVRRRSARGVLTTGEACGMTLLEMTVVIMVLLLILSVTFIGAAAWKKGVDRARCIMNIRQMQVSVRAYSNFKKYEPGFDPGNGSPDFSLLDELVGPGQFVPELPECPRNGVYFFGGDAIPAEGTLYMTCSLAHSDGHVPDDYGSW